MREVCDHSHINRTGLTNVDTCLFFHFFYSDSSVIMSIKGRQAFVQRLGPVARWRTGTRQKPFASEVLTAQLEHHPHWTSYFIRYSDIINDQYGYSHFNWTVNGANYHILRIGCPPYIKYHCSRRSYQNLELEDRLFRALKWANLGIPTLCYGFAAIFLIKHHRDVRLPDGRIVRIFFLNQENIDSQF